MFEPPAEREMLLAGDIAAAIRARGGEVRRYEAGPWCNKTHTFKNGIGQGHFGPCPKDEPLDLKRVPVRNAFRKAWARWTKQEAK